MTSRFTKKKLRVDREKAKRFNLKPTKREKTARLLIKDDKMMRSDNDGNTAMRGLHSA
jgi:hypothetical protein